LSLLEARSIALQYHNYAVISGIQVNKLNMAFPSVLQVGILAIISYFIYAYFQKRQLKLPPGPKPLPILGNIRDLPPPSVPEFQHWLKHKDLYGPISSVSVMGMTLITIHDKEMAHDLLERHSSQLSGRPKMVFANELCGYESAVACRKYDSRLRHCRKLMHRELGTRASAANFHDAQEIAVKRQLVRVLNDAPGKLLEHFPT
jgi:hypothetical protein